MTRAAGTGDSEGISEKREGKREAAYGMGAGAGIQRA